MHSSHVPQPYLNGGGRMDMGRVVAPDFRGGGGGGDYPGGGGGGGMSMNGHGYGRGGYPVAAPGGGVRGRSADRDRDRDRERCVVKWLCFEGFESLVPVIFLHRDADALFVFLLALPLCSLTLVRLQHRQQSD